MSGGSDNERERDIGSSDGARYDSGPVSADHLWNNDDRWIGWDPHKYRSDPSFRSELRNWWHEILREKGKYYCYIILLALSSDKEAIRYFKDYGKEIDFITGDKCLVIALTSSAITEIKSWEHTMNEYIDGGYSVKVAQLFDVTLDKFPALLVFQDIRSSEHMLYSLSDKSAEEISKIMRAILSIIHKAIANDVLPLEALKNQNLKDDVNKTGQAIFGSIKSITSKTLETVFQTVIETMIK